MEKSILIINLGAGNVNSVFKAFKSLGARVEVINSSQDLTPCKAIILPGVGNFKQAMDDLVNKGFLEKLNRLVIEKKTPFFGICLGMQLLAEEGEENGKTKGIGWIPGKVVRLNQKDIRIPHIGWDDIQIVKSEPLFKGIEESSSFYFVHSYHFQTDEKFITSECFYGQKIASSVQKDNIFGVQFHPEKSQKKGIQIIKNFLDYLEGKNGS